MNTAIAIVAAAISVTGYGSAPTRALSPAEIEIVGSDYAFQAPAIVPAGRIAFRFVNKGKVQHELNIASLKKGVSVDDYVRTVKKGESVRELIEGPVGVLFAGPGQSSYSLLTTDAKRGSTLAVICIFRDSAKAPRHYEMGMFASIRVGSAVPAPLPHTTVDTIVGTDYAYRYPRELTEGRHTIVFRNDGKMRHELAMDMLVKGATLATLQAAEKAGANVDSLFDKGIGVLHVYGGQSPLGQLIFDVLPGREYLIACFFKDDDKAPPHYKLGMFGSIKGVAKKPGER